MLCKHHNLPNRKGTPFCERCHQDLDKSSKVVQRVFRAKHPGKMEEAIKNKL